MLKMNAHQLRTTVPDPEVVKSLPKNPIYILLDDVLDTYNVGSIFRLADAIQAERVILCGETLTPPNSRIKKASINTWQWVPWEYNPSITDAISKLRQEHKDKKEIKIVAIEQNEKSISYYKAQYDFPLALIVGNETRGVSKEALEMVDMIVELPMWGINISLNVMVSLGIMLYYIMGKYSNE